MLVYGGEGYINIKTHLLSYSKRKMQKVINSKIDGIGSAGWKREGFSTIQDWARKEIALIDFELKRRESGW